MATKKKTDGGKAKKPKTHVQNLRMDADEMAAVDQAVKELGGEPYRRSHIVRAAFKRGLQGLVKGGVTPEKVKRATAISFASGS